MRRLVVPGITFLVALGLFAGLPGKAHAAKMLIIPWVQVSLVDNDPQGRPVANVALGIMRTEAATDNNDDIYIFFGAADNDNLDKEKGIGNTQATKIVVKPWKTRVLRAGDFRNLVRSHYGNSTSTTAAVGMLRICENKDCTSSIEDMAVWGSTFYTLSGGFAGFPLAVVER